MAKIPNFLLRALYVKGSLKNNEDGFEFQMKNDFGPVQIIDAHPLTLDSRPVPLESCRFLIGEYSAGFTDVTPDESVLMNKGEAISVQVAGVTLKPGRRNLGIDVLVKDLGQIRFTVSDKV
jgi:hypothetical protein